MKRTLSLLLCAPALLAAQPVDISRTYRIPAQKLIDAALADQDGMRRLEYLCDRIGDRLSGSASLELAIQWAAAEMKAAGLENLQTPPVKVPHWIRGQESALMLEPVNKPLTMIGLGMSAGTPKQGIAGDVVVADSFDELKALGRAKVEGKIVLFNPPWMGYGPTVVYRTAGPSAAARLGAQAVLVRSMTGLAVQTPHTGATQYEDGAPKIPAAALSVEGGTPVQVRLAMEAHQEPYADSHNVMGEIRGSQRPEEVVVLGGHIDSWDIGQGANDDGSGIMAALQAVALIKKLGLHPRRTIRVVFWVNEQNGGAGGVAYRAMLGDQVKNHVAAIEMDGGAKMPLGFGFTGTPAVSPAAFQRAVEIGKLLAGVQGGEMVAGGGGSDIGPLMADGVPGFGVRTTGTHYFDWRHTDADSFDKIVPREFQLNVAALAVLSYVVADMPERFSEMK